MKVSHTAVHWSMVEWVRPMISLSYNYTDDKWHKESYLKTTCIQGALVTRCIEELKASMIASVFIIQFDGTAWKNRGTRTPPTELDASNHTQILEHDNCSKKVTLQRTNKKTN